MTGGARLAALILLLSGCDGPSDAPAPMAGEPGTPSIAVDESACSDVACAALAGVCREASCDARTGACRVGPAHEGEPCLERNPCGASECRSGECVPLAPPACAELSDECTIGVCRPDRGCVAEPRVVPGTNEEHAVRLRSRGVGRATASSVCQAQTFAPVSCTEGLTGPSAIFELDLSEATEPTNVGLLVDALFDFEAALTRGPSADPAVQHCGEPFYTDGKSRRLSAELEPGRYHLVVTGRSAADRGRISVASTVEAPDGAALTNDDCATPLALDGSIEQQSIIPDRAGATPQVTVRCAPLGASDVFYELDLSARSSEVLLDVEVAELEGGYFFSSAALLATRSDFCGEALTCGKVWSRRVSPGIHKLALHIDPGLVEDSVGVRIRATEMSCLTTTNDRWETAVDLDPTLAAQRLQGNTACGNDDSSVCSEDRGAPDLFYRLDLRGHGAPQFLQLEGAYANGLQNYVLVASSDTEALPPTRCEAADASFRLAPRLYYLVIDGLAQAAGPFDLQLRLQDAYSVPSDCLTAPDDFKLCLDDSEPACAISIAHPDCIRAAVDCGLAADVYVSFCTALPGCCDGTASVESCEAPWRGTSGCPR